MSRPKASVLAHRFAPSKCYVPRLWSLGFQIAICGAATWIVYCLITRDAEWLVAAKLLLACAVATICNTRWRPVEIRPPLIEEEHPDWLTLVQQIAASDDPEERDSIYFGTTVEEDEL